MKDTRKPGGPRKPGGTSGKPFRKDGPRGDEPRKAYTSRPKTAAKPNPAHVEVTGEGERISKVMARAGVASRRDCERMIMEGRVALNGKVLESPAVNVTGKDRIEVDGQEIGAIERTRLWIYYKPLGLVTTNHDPEGRPTVFDNLPEELPRVISVGRLDINTEGLLLLTNDGGLARMLELPSTGWLRRYRVRAYGSIDQARLDELKEGIAVDGVLYGAIEATLDREQGHNVWITMGLREGKNREIKNVLGALGLDVNRLIRISYGPFQLGELEEGNVVEVKSRTLRDQLGPRLIEEANANFEAPIFNAPVEVKAEAPAAREWSAGERPRRESREDRRERDLDRIDTKKPERGFSKDRDRGGDRGDRRAGGKDDKKPKRLPLGSSRTANVWMAPGARPVAPKKEKAKAEEPATGSGRRVLRLKTDGAETSEAPVRKARGDRADRPAKSFERKPREDGERTFAARKPRAAQGDAERPARSARPARSFNDDGASSAERPKRSFAAKPRGADGPRSDRPGSDRPRSERPRSERPRSEKPASDRPRSGAPRAEGARAERPRSDKPRSDKPRSDKPHSDRPRSDNPRGDAPRSGPGGGSKGPGRGADRRR
ncbi:MAG: pseudouridine synthase [Rhizobium sp.]|nr:pseudouridine synthase [Rhizobium sp.]